MAVTHAMWTHGNSMQIEFPDRLTSVWRAGFYIRVESEADQDNWFHFAIPTTVLVDDVRMRAESVMIRFRTGASSGKVTAVHVYDGENRIATHDGLALNPNDWAFERFDVPGNPEVYWGLGISIGVSFPGRPGSMEFSSAGCDLLR